MAAFFFLFLSLFLAPVLTDKTYEFSDDSTKIEPAVREMYSEIYADSLMKAMTLDEKIAQLIMLDVYPNKNETYYKTVDNWVREKKIGGIIFFRGQPAEIAKLSDRFTAISAIPLWVGLDAEWGVSMRVDSIRRLPYALTLGAVSDNAVVREYGNLVAKQCKRFGVNMNMAPVADVNNNPRNPVINYRSFGENPNNVAMKAVAYYLGMNDEGVISVAKHFPGHGNTDADSHYELPLIHDSQQVIDSIHLLPFRELIKYGVPGCMSAHLFVPALDSTLNRASSLSPVILNDLLLNKLKFHGFVITDALGMKGVSSIFKPGEIEVKALLAGNDILLMPQKPQIAIDSIKAAVHSGRIPESLIDEKCRKLLKFKYLYLGEKRTDLDSYTKIPEELNNQEVNDFIYRIFCHSTTLLVNKDSILPLKKDISGKISVVSIGKQQDTEFVKKLRSYFEADHVKVGSSPVEMEINRTISVVEESQTVIICLYGMNNSAGKNYGVSASAARLVQRLSAQKDVVLILFGNPYGINHMGDISNIRSIVVAYEEHDESEAAAAMCVSGQLPFLGKLPVSAGGFQAGTGIVGEVQQGLIISDPEKMNIKTDVLQEIDKIVQDAIDKGAMPGCQIVLAQHGKVFYNKSFGYHTFEKTQPVLNSDIYDLASLTKILATTAAVMKLFGEDRIMLEDQIEKHLPWMENSPVGKLTVLEIMTHQSGLISWIPFYKSITATDSLRSVYFADQYSEEFSVPVAENLWMLTSYRDSIFQRILNSNLQRKRYKYSDLGFYLLKELVESMSGYSFEEYLRLSFYQPMQLYTMTFNPLNKFSKDRIIPTENDQVFRNQLVHGFVHDPGAALLGGVAGHAGLFANAMDVASMMQMFLDYGTYAGHRYLDSMAVVKFTARQFTNNRRGIGFDRPAGANNSGNTSDQASSLSFGHTGFTGTFAWADPKHGLVVVFLSNRIHPDAENKKLMSLEVRKKVQELAYKAISIQ